MQTSRFKGVRAVFDPTLQADSTRTSRHVCFVPDADIQEFRPQSRRRVERTLELRRISEPRKSPVTSARESAEVGRHLTELQVPAMRGVHASPNYMATAVVLVVPIAGGVRVIAISIPIRGIAIRSE